MAWWKYILLDPAGNVICEDTGYENEDDAESFGHLAAEMLGIHDYTVQTEQSWEDLD